MMTPLKKLSYIVVDEEINPGQLSASPKRENMEYLQRSNPEVVNMIDAVSKILVDGSSKHVLPPIHESNSKVNKDKVAKCTSADDRTLLPFNRSDSCLNRGTGAMGLDYIDDQQSPIIAPSPRQRSLSLTPKAHTATGQLTRRRSEVRSDLVGRRRRSSNSQELQSTAELLAVTKNSIRPDSSLDLV
jgi:hypothetical protein